MDFVSTRSTLFMFSKLIYNRDLDGGDETLCSKSIFIMQCINNTSFNRFSCSLNECYFAMKGTALMLGSNERLQRGDGRCFSQVSNELSASQTSISSSSDIQQHLQSMFYLLRPEETLKMVSIARNCDENIIERLRGHSHSSKRATATRQK